MEGEGEGEKQQMGLKVQICFQSQLLWAEEERHLFISSVCLGINLDLGGRAWRALRINAGARQFSLLLSILWE